MDSLTTAADDAPLVARAKTSYRAGMTAVRSATVLDGFALPVGGVEARGVCLVGIRDLAKMRLSNVSKGATVAFASLSSR